VASSQCLTLSYSINNLFCNTNFLIFQNNDTYIYWNRDWILTCKKRSSGLKILKYDCNISVEICGERECRATSHKTIYMSISLRISNLTVPASITYTWINLPIYFIWYNFIKKHWHRWTLNTCRCEFQRNLSFLLLTCKLQDNSWAKPGR
jgi:hypothetical protein